MGLVPLLTREQEVTIAKRLERGSLRVLKIVPRSPIVLKALISVADDLRSGNRSIKEIVQIDEEDLTEAKIEEKTRHTLRTIDKIAKLHELGMKQRAKLKSTGTSDKRACRRTNRMTA